MSCHLGFFDIGGLISKGSRIRRAAARALLLPVRGPSGEHGEAAGGDAELDASTEAVDARTRRVTRVISCAAAAAARGRSRQPGATQHR